MHVCNNMRGVCTEARNTCCRTQVEVRTQPAAPFAVWTSGTELRFSGPSGLDYRHE